MKRILKPDCLRCILCRKDESSCMEYGDFKDLKKKSYRRGLKMSMCRKTDREKQERLKELEEDEKYINEVLDEWEKAEGNMAEFEVNLRSAGLLEDDEDVWDIGILIPEV